MVPYTKCDGSNVRIYAKIGSLPAKYIHVVRKRKPPIVGEAFKWKEPGSRARMRWQRPDGALCREIKSVDGVALYVCERF